LAATGRRMIGVGPFKKRDVGDRIAVDDTVLGDVVSDPRAGERRTCGAMTR
jgi:hypothetical protein